VSFLLHIDPVWLGFALAWFGLWQGWMQKRRDARKPKVATATIAPMLKPLSPWTDLAVNLWLATEDMDAAEFEALFDVAVTGERPDDDRLPSVLPFDIRGAVMQIAKEQPPASFGSGRSAKPHGTTPVISMDGPFSDRQLTALVDAMYHSGPMTVNEMRERIGQPLLTAPDDPRPGDIEPG
jgi:hypothetical protein